MKYEREKAVEVALEQFENDELRVLYVSLATVRPDQLQERDRGLALVMSEIARSKLKERGLGLTDQ